MNMPDVLLDCLKNSQIPLLYTDTDLVPQYCNQTALELMPGLTYTLPLPEQYPALVWLTVLPALRLMRPVTFVLSEGGERLSLTMVPCFLAGSLQGTFSLISPAATLQSDPSYAMALHDLSTPIASIGSCADLLAGHVPENQRPYLDIIKRSTLYIQRIISGIASTLDAASLSSSGENICLGDTVKRIVELVRQVVPPGGKLSISQRGSTSTVVHCNSLHLERILTNLLDNAVRYARKHILLRIGEEEGLGVVTIEDDGPGIPTLDLPHIFTPWFTSEYAFSRSGLGLSVAYQLTRVNGGRLDVESAASGTRFLLRLPLGDAGQLSQMTSSLSISPQFFVQQLELALQARADASPK
ncbi:MAG: HAMP domain-containing histidine kinase [Clostridiales bacterium]|nr:HAMP domain-containing histidine kinase [Clostridiales bacterium]